MPRKTNSFTTNILGTNVQVQEKYYLNNKDLPTVDSTYQWTPEMIMATTRCTKDIKYFAENFFTIIAQGKRMHIPLRDYQKDVLDSMITNNRILMCTSRQIGKCFSKNTKIRLRLLGLSISLKASTLWRFLKIVNSIKGQQKPCCQSLLSDTELQQQVECQSDKLSDKVYRKFVEVLDASFVQIESDQGWTDVKTMNKTVEYQVYRIHFESGRVLECADTHIIIDKDYNEIFAKDSLGCEILTSDGTDTVTDIEITNRWENMYDFQLTDDSNHLYYADGVLSHNTTLMTIYALWLANFFPDQKIIICGDKKATATMIFENIRLAYMELPNWLKCPIEKFSEASMKLSNGSKIVTSPTTDSAIRGNAVSCLILDEFAFVDPSIAQKFWTSVTPTLITNPNARMFVSSTPNGVGNMFHQLYENAINGKSKFVVKKVIWSDVPGRDEKWKQETIATEMNNNVEQFEQEYECKFLGASASPFGDEVFDRMRKDERPPKETGENGKLLIWEYPRNDRVYTVGVDVGEGVGRDASVIQVFDVTDLTSIDQVACFSSPDIGPSEFSKIVNRVCGMYGMPQLSIERNSVGGEVVSRLYDDMSYPRLVSYGSNEKRPLPGIRSNAQTKSPAMTNWKYWLIERGVLHIHDARYREELEHFENLGHGRWSAEKGYHDDLIMASVWALNALHRDVVAKVFDVYDFNVDGYPVKVYNKFDYHVDYTEDSLAYQYKDYHVPVVLFTSATHKNIYNPNDVKFNDQPDSVWNLFDENSWERLPEW